MDVDRFTTETVNHVIESGILNHVQQLLIRTDYSNSIRSNIHYITALNQLRQLYDYGFRIYWTRMEFKCVLQHNRNRTSCIYIHMVILIYFFSCLVRFVFFGVKDHSSNISLDILFCLYVWSLS